MTSGQNQRAGLLSAGQCGRAAGPKSCSCSGCAGTRCRRTSSWDAHSTRRGTDSSKPQA